MNSFIEKLRTEISGGIIGHTIFHQDEIDSTNNWAFEQAQQGATHGSIFIADSQSQGRGRLGHHWHSPATENIYCSILLEPTLTLAELSKLTLLTGAAVCESLRQFTSQNIMLKWPNDIYYQHRKLGGILCESRLRGKYIQHVVIGVGINLSSKEFSGDLKSQAISLQEICPGKTHRSTIIATFVKSFSRWYQKLDQDGQDSWEPVMLFCNKHHLLTGKKITLKHAGQRIHGVVKHINNAGELVLIRENGQAQSFLAGETHIKEIEV